MNSLINSHFLESGTARRELYEEMGCYILDAKTSGNVGRYLNHSCDPNVFVQNVFVDTHDLRFVCIVDCYIIDFFIKKILIKIK